MLPSAVSVAAVSVLRLPVTSGPVLCLALLTGGLPFSGELLVENVEPLRLRAIKVEPVVADEVVLVEDGPVRAQEGGLAQTAADGATRSNADVEDLTTVYIIIKEHFS